MRPIKIQFARLWRFYLLLFLTVLTSPCPLTSQAVPLIDSLTAALGSAEQPASEVELLIALSREYLNVDPNKGTQYGQEALDLARKEGLSLLEASANNYLGGNAIMLGNYEMGLEYFFSAKAIYRSLDNTKGEADITGNLGYVYANQGNYDKALELELEALEIFEELSDSVGLTNTLQFIGNIYMETGSLDKALVYDSMALDISRASRNLHGEALLLGNMGNIYSELGDHEKAIDLHEQAISIFTDINMPLEVSREMSNLSTDYEAIKDIGEAIRLIQSASKLSEDSGFHMGEVLSEGNLGAYYLTAYQLKESQDTSAKLPEGTLNSYLVKARNHLNTAYELAGREQNVVFKGWLAEKLAEVYERTNEEGLALSLYKVADEIQDSVYSIETKSQIERLTTEREIALKNKQIELDRLAVLKKRNERIYFLIGIGLLILSLGLLYRNYHNQRKSNTLLTGLNSQISLTNETLETKNTSLKTALTELKETQDQLIIVERQKEKALLRSRFSRDIHDDISSGLTKIAWLAENLKITTSPDPGTKESQLVDKISNSAKGTVSKLGEIIWSTSPERDNLGGLIDYIRHHLQEFLDSSQFKYRLEAKEVDLEASIHPQVRRNLFLVFKEAVNNAFKYSKGDKIKVSFETDGFRYQLEISDNGRGIKADTVEGGGHGLQNMKHRMEAINGVFNIASEEENGTRLSFTGPLEI